MTRLVMILIDMYYKMFQHLEDLPNLMNQYFPNDQCIMVQNHAQIKKNTLEAQDWSLDVT